MKRAGVVLRQKPIPIVSSEQRNGAMLQNEMDRTPDSSSKFTGKFCWEEIEGIAVPFIIRSSGEMLAEINMLKKALFRKQLEVLDESIFNIACSSDMNKPPKKYQASKLEKILLNEINSVHCDYYFNKTPNMPCPFLLAKNETIKLYKVLNFFSNLVTEKTINDTNCGYIRFNGNNTPVPFVTLKRIGIIVPLFFFDCPEVMHMNFELKEHWALVYFKLLCKLLSIVKIFYDQQTLLVVRLANLKELFPETRQFTILKTIPLNANILEFTRAKTLNPLCDQNIVSSHSNIRVSQPETIEIESDNEIINISNRSSNKRYYLRKRIDVRKTDQKPKQVEKFPKIAPKNINQRDESSNNNGHSSSTSSESTPYLVNHSSQVVATPSGGYILQTSPVLGNTLFQPPQTSVTDLSNSYVLNSLSGILTPVSSAGFMLPFPGTVREQMTQQQQTSISMEIPNSFIIVQQNQNTVSTIPETATNLIQSSLVPHALTSSSQQRELRLLHVSSPSSSTLKLKPKPSVLKPKPKPLKVSESDKSMHLKVCKMSSKCIRVLRYDSREILYGVNEIPEHFSLERPLSYRVEMIVFKGVKHQFICISKSPFEGGSLLINILDVKRILFPEINRKKFMSAAFEMKLDIFSLNTSQKAILAKYYTSEEKAREYLYFSFDEFRRVYGLMKRFFRMAR